MSASRVFVVYHGTPGSEDGCVDGFTACWAAWRAFGEDAVYLPAEYGGPVPDIPSGARVYMLDVSFPRSVMDELASRATLAVIDHHASAEKELEGAPYAWFRMDRSGAALSWMHFHPDEPIPNLVLFVEDRDLWNWKLDSSRAINAAIANTPQDFRQWDYLEATLRSPDLGINWPYRLLHQTGEALLREQQRLVRHFARNVYVAEVGGILVPCCNATAHVSELGEYLLTQFPDYPFVAIWQRRADGALNWNLRSRRLPNGRESFHVGEFARKQFGGGGHPMAAGFREHPVNPLLVVNDMKAFLGEAMAEVDPRSKTGCALHDRYRHWRRGKTHWLGSKKPPVHGPSQTVRDAND